jgi:hypothetical protein
MIIAACTIWQDFKDYCHNKSAEHINWLIYLIVEAKICRTICFILEIPFPK